MSSSNLRFLDFSKDSKSKSDAFWYRVVYLLGSLQALILRRCIKRPVWRSFDGTVHTPQSMSDKHLVNTLLLCERNNETDHPTYTHFVVESQRRGLRNQIDKQRRRNLRFVGGGDDE